MHKSGIQTDLNGYFSKKNVFLTVCAYYSNREPFCIYVQFVPVRSCLMALYKLTKDSDHTSRWCSAVELTIFWAVYTKVNKMRSKSSWCRWPIWLERSEMSLNMSVSLLGMISSQMTSRFLVLRREASSASCTVNSPLASKLIPASRI